MKDRLYRIINLILIVCMIISFFSSVFASVNDSNSLSIIKEEPVKTNRATSILNLEDEKKDDIFHEEIRKDKSIIQDNDSLKNKSIIKDNVYNNSFQNDLKNKKSDEKLKNKRFEDDLINKELEEVSRNNKLEEELKNKELNEELKRNKLEEEFKSKAKNIDPSQNEKDLIEKYWEIVIKNKFISQKEVNIDEYINNLDVLNLEENGNSPNVSLKGTLGYKDCIEINFDYLKAKEIKSIDINLDENIEIVKELYSKNDILKIENILRQIEDFEKGKKEFKVEDILVKDKRDLRDILYEDDLKINNLLNDNTQSIDNLLKLNSIEYNKHIKNNSHQEIKDFIKELKLIKPYYSLEDMGLIIRDENINDDLSLRTYTLDNINGSINNIKLVIRVNEKSFNKDLLSINIKDEFNEDEISIVNKSLSSFKMMAFENTAEVQEPEIIGVDDIAPSNYLQLLENMPGATVKIESGPGVIDIVNLPQNTNAVDGALWGGDWSYASKNIFTLMGSTAATSVKFKPSVPDTTIWPSWYSRHSKEIDAGWDPNDLNINTTSMWVKVKYTNAAYYKNEIVDAEATIKLTPMKNRNENSYAYHDYGDKPYHPILQISHNLYKGWCWQNVKEINVDLVFKKKNGQTIRFDSSTFGDANATYFTINSLNQEDKHEDNNLQYGSVHLFGPEYVRPKEDTVTGAYVIPGSHILTSYYGSSSGVQYAYNGGHEKWNGDNPSHENWSQNSVLFTTANTDHLNFTMGNLMRDPRDGFVARTNFVWTSMSTQSFANHYVNYKDIEVEKNWSDSNLNHDPITVNLLKSYKVRIKYQGHPWWNEETRDIEIKNLLDKSITISRDNDWKGIFKQVPDEDSQNRLIKKAYNKNSYQLIIDSALTDLPDNYQIESVSDFSYSIDEVKVNGYQTEINKKTIYDEYGKLVKDSYEIINTKEGDTPPGPGSLKPQVKIHKQIDYLGDGQENPDTDIQRNDSYKDNLEDIYRLYLDVEGERLRKEEPTDLLFILDASSSMIFNRDMKGYYGYQMDRREAMVEMINETDLVKNFLNQNKDNRVAYVSFNGSVMNRRTQKWQGYSYKDDSKIISDWSNQFKTIDVEIDGNFYGTNYQAGLLRAEDLLNKSKKTGHRQAMIFISDGVPTFWIDSEGNRQENGNYRNKRAVENSKRETKNFLNGFFQRHPDLIIHAIGVSKDINEENTHSSQSPEVLKYMAENGNGSYIGVKTDTKELVEKLKHAIEAAVTEVRIEDTLSDRVELVAEEADYKVVKKDIYTGKEIVLWENGQATWENGYGYDQIIKDLNYDDSKKKIILNFNPNYKLEENTKYILSYNIMTNKKAQDDYMKDNKYDAVGDKDTDYGGNSTSSEKSGFRSNKEANIFYNGGKKDYPHPVVQVKEHKGFELPITGGKGIVAIKVIGGIVIGVALISLLRKKK